LPAYAIWYTVLPREAGGKLFSEPLGRMVFTLFLVLSTPVGLHHQFQDPGIPAGWKLFHTFNTMIISFPSLVTAFTIVASLEIAGRLRGGTGLFGWIRTLPWGNPLVSSVLLACLLFMVGGFGGAVNAAYALNSVVHNTAWIAAHFHLTVGSAAALTFMGACYWLVPKVSGRELELKLLAKVQPYLWFLGMALFSFTGHIAEHCAALRELLAFPDEFELILEDRTEAELQAIQQEIVNRARPFLVHREGAAAGERDAERVEVIGGDDVREDAAGDRALGQTQEREVVRRERDEQLLHKPEEYRAAPAASQIPHFPRRG